MGEGFRAMLSAEMGAAKLKVRKLAPISNRHMEANLTQLRYPWRLFLLLMRL